MRGIDAGQRFTLSGHPDHDRDAADQREFAVIETVWTIENNLPVSSDAPVFPHSLQATVAAVRARHEGASAPGTPIGEGSEGFYRVDIEAQRTTVPYRSPFEHAKPDVQLESAIVVGPQNEEVYTDELNRIKVRFIWDRLNSGDERASCWLRVVQSDSGGGYGGVHLPRVGEEVLVDYVDGDCDRPIVVARVYNGATKPQWHSNGLLSGYRSKEFGGSGYNQLVMDDATGQSRLQLFSSSANSYLHMGYLIAQNGNERGGYLGSGFDLKSDAFGAVRASQGLYVTTHPTVSQPLDARAASTQLVNAESVMDAMSDASTTHQAKSLEDGYGALKSFMDATQNRVAGSSSGGSTAGGGTGAANTFKRPVMLFGSPSGIALSTQQSVHVTSDAQTNLVSGQSMHIATGKSLVASVAQSISLFVQNAGIKLFSGKGKVEIRAHSDDVEVTAQKSLKLLSATENVEAAAAKAVLLTSGGAYIKVANGNIEIHAPGQISIKGAQHSFNGPASTSYSLPDLPVSGPTPYSQKFLFRSIDEGASTEGVRYAMFTTPTDSSAASQILAGTSTVNGSDRRLNPETGGTLSTLYGTGEWGTTFDLFVDSDDEQMLGEQSDTGDKNGVASA
jgi:type VI secretion system secreted protein VgrG